MPWCIWGWLWWGDVMSIWEGVGFIWLEILIWRTLIYHCLHGDTNLTWRIDMSNQLPYPHPRSPRHMMEMNRAWDVRKPLCKETRSVFIPQEFVFNPWDVAFPMAVVLKNQPIANNPQAVPVAVDRTYREQIPKERKEKKERKKNDHRMLYTNRWVVLICMRWMKPTQWWAGYIF